MRKESGTERKDSRTVRRNPGIVRNKSRIVFDQSWTVRKVFRTVSEEGFKECEEGVLGL